MPTPAAVAAPQAPTPAPLPAPVAAPVAVAPAPQAAPHSQTAQDPEGVAQRERIEARRAALREAPRAIPVTDIAVILGVQCKDAGRQEVIYDIGGGKHRILKVTHETIEKVKPVTQDGEFLGYEPTGEYEFNLKVKYLRE